MTTNPMTKGFFTSEFYLGLFMVVFTYINKYFNWNLPPDQIAAIAGVVITYITSRTLIKLKAPETPQSKLVTPPINP